MTNRRPPVSTPQSGSADRNLLFGILALQMDFIDRDDLVAAMNAWVLQKSKSLGQVLLEQGKLSPPRLQLLEALVGEHLQAHAGDPQQSLAALSSVSSVQQVLHEVADADVQASLAHVPADAPKGEGTVSYHSLGASTPGLRYRILRPHAKGGLGEVFLAEDTELHREVALKEIRKEHAGDRNSRGRFVLEAEITGALEHPGIVPIYGLGSYADGRPFYAMRFIKGANLKEAIQRFHQPSPPRQQGERNVAFRELLGRFVDMCQAVAYAHSRGILHRDLKPGNVMLGKYGETLVVDWGLAKPLASRGRESPEAAGDEATLRPSSADSDLAATRPGSAIGTPAYMSPEQAAGRLDQLGPASDIYSLGATLYAVLTGQPPFAGDAGEVLRQVQRGDFPAPRRVKADIPPALEAICLKAMALQPEQRYRTALQLAEDIEHWLADEPVSAWPEPITVRVARWARQHRPLVSGVAAALVVAVLAAGVGGYWYQQAKAERYAEQLRQQELARQELGQAVKVREALHRVLIKEGSVRRLLNEPARWAGQLQEVQLHLDKAHALLAQAGQESDSELGQRWQTLEEQRTHDEADRRWAVQLDKIRQDRSVIMEGKFDTAKAARLYPQVFAQAGLDVAARVAPEVLGTRIRRSSIREQWLAALDDWAFVAWRTQDKALWRRLLAVARSADPDPWRQLFRTEATWNDRQQVAKLADQLRADPAALARQSPQMLGLVGTLLILHHSDAAGWLRQAQTQHPADFWLNYDLARALAKVETGEAAGYFRAALAVRPQSTAAWNNLGVALHAQKKLAEAEDAYRHALKIDPQSALAWTNLGIARRDQKQLAEAVAAYRQALKIDPQLALAWYSFGNALHAQKKLAEAVAAYRQALEIDPQDAKALSNLGAALRDQRKPAEAIVAFREALKIEPQSGLVWTNLGVALCDQKQLAEAEDAFRRALKIDPQYALAWTNLGNALAAQKQLAEAVDAYRRALKIDPHNAKTWCNLGIALRDQNQLPAAIEAYRNALKADQRNAQAWYSLGNALRDQKQLPAAVEAYQKAVEIDQQYVKAWYNLGHALYEQKQLPAPVAAYKKVVALAPTYAEASCNLGHALRDQGHFAEALKYLEKGHQLGSKRPGWPYPSAQWVQQCRASLQTAQQAAALAQGQAQAAGPTELLQLAQFCRRYQRPYTATRLYTAAFAAQPTLAQDLTKGQRYQAACAAALSAQGQAILDQDDNKLTATDKAKLRQQALDWLRADLKLLTRTVADYQAAGKEANQPPASPLEKLTGQTQKPGPADLLRVCDRLHRCQTDPDLASVREDKELAKLPEPEQKDWRQLWDEVRGLDKQARACFSEKQLSGRLTEQHKEQVHEVKLQAGQTYIFDLESTAFDAFLRLEDARGQKLAENDDLEPGVILNSRIVFRPLQDGAYRLVATSFQGQGVGAYVVRVREFAAPQKQPPSK
jgi:tetratricopeptide (TPR) repeat protein/tRNA A-37 threonylcarbamoyl transferase component Bud32